MTNGMISKWRYISDLVKYLNLSTVGNELKVNKWKNSCCKKHGFFVMQNLIDMELTPADRLLL